MKRTLATKRISHRIFSISFFHTRSIFSHYQRMVKWKDTRSWWKNVRCMKFLYPSDISRYVWKKILFHNVSLIFNYLTIKSFFKSHFLNLTKKTIFSNTLLSKQFFPSRVNFHFCSQILKKYSKFSQKKWKLKYLTPESIFIFNLDRK